VRKNGQYAGCRYMVTDKLRFRLDPEKRDSRF
jgi:hypothetical protein